MLGSDSIFVVVCGLTISVLGSAPTISVVCFGSTIFVVESTGGAAVLVTVDLVISSWQEE